MKRIQTHWLIVALVVLSAAVRLAYTSSYRFEGMGRDSAGYMKLAENFATGEGWVNSSVQFLYALPESIPHPDSYWSPLFPFLISLVYRLFGVSYSIAQIVPVTFGILVPALLLFLVYELTRLRVAAIAAGVIAAIHPTLVMWSNRVQPEIVTIFFFTLTLGLL